MEIFFMLLKIIIFLPLVIFLIYLSLKYGGSKLQNMQNGRFLKILEKTPISKENSILVAQMGDKAYVLSSTEGKVEILKELTDEELCMLNESKSIPEYKNLNEFILSIKDKLKNKKEE
ncbi:flagellar biosynthesis protein FliZ [Clostridium acetobutylicum]|nr:flagellar biosynthesis protein FliZ [Clostridium acetobutylicum]